jgi:hypothetical protein
VVSWTWRQFRRMCASRIAPPVFFGLAPAARSPTSLGIIRDSALSFIQEPFRLSERELFTLRMLDGGFGTPEIPMFIEQADTDSLRKVRYVKTLAPMARK